MHLYANRPAACEHADYRHRAITSDVSAPRLFATAGATERVP